MGTLNVNTSFNIDLHFDTAPVHIRFFAWLIDCILLGLYYWIVFYKLLPSLGTGANSVGIDYVLYLPFFCYHLLFELFNHGQSLGKMALGLRVVSTDGKEETNTQAMIRWLLRTLDFGGLIFILLISSGFVRLGFLQWMLAICNGMAIILFLTTKYNQRLGDIAASTVVVFKKLPYDLNDTIFRELRIENYTVQFPGVMNLSDNDINIIDNVVKRHKKTKINNYLESIAVKIKAALDLETDLEDDIFLETLLNDYNYLSRK